MLLFYNALFLGTGIVQTLLQQALFYEGAADKRTLLPTTAAYLGVSLNLVLPLLGISEAMRPGPDHLDTKNKGITRDIWVYGTVLGLLEVLGSGEQFLLISLLTFAALSFLSIAYAGSGLYQVIYSSITIFVAIETKFLLGRKLPRTAWVGILLTTVGLVASTQGAHTGENDESKFSLLHEV